MVDIGEARAKKVTEIATEMDARWQRRNLNQRASISRLLNASGVDDPEVAVREIERLNAELALEQRKYANLCDWLRRDSGLNANLTRGEIDQIIIQVEAASKAELPAAKDKTSGPE